MARRKFNVLKYSIYCYTCPITSEIFYVGQDSKRGVRGAATDQHNHGIVQHKLNKLFALGLQPIITRLCQFDSVIDGDPVKELNRAETYWIAEGRRLGWPLTNMTDGGDVTSGWACLEETRLKISLANRGKKRTPEQCERNAEAHRGLQHSNETKTKMSRTRKGRALSDDHVEALKATWHEHHDESTFEKIAASKRGKPRNAATRAKLSASLKGKPWSEARKRAHQTRSESRLDQIVQVDQSESLTTS